MCQSSSNEVCKKLFDYKKYPTFIQISNGQSREINPERTVEGFTLYTENLKQIDFRLNCNQYPAQKERFPAFVIHLNTTRQETCRYLENFRKYSDNFYAGPTAAQPFLQIDYSWKTSLNYSGPLSPSIIEAFYQEYSKEPFGDWPIKDGLNCKRKLSFLIYGSRKPRFQDIADEFMENYVFGSVSSYEFNEIYTGQLSINSEDLPALAITNKRKTQFYIVKNIDKDASRKALIDGLCHNLNRNMTHSLRPLTRDNQQIKSEKQEAAIFMLLGFLLICAVYCILIMFKHKIQFRRKKIHKFVV